MKNVAYQKLFGIEQIDTLNRALLVHSGANRIFEDTDGEALDIFFDIFKNEMLINKYTVANMLLYNVSNRDKTSAIPDNKYIILEKLDEAGISYDDELYPDALNRALELFKDVQVMLDYNTCREHIKTIV